MRILIEVERGSGWKSRGEGECEVTIARAIDEMRAMSRQYPHRLWIDGRLIAEVAKPGRAPRIVRR